MNSAPTADPVRSTKSTEPTDAAQNVFRIPMFCWHSVRPVVVSAEELG